MKFLLSVFISLSFLLADAQQSCFKIAKDYYRSDPFNKEFSNFLNHLLKDPGIKDVSQNKKTDSTLYFFSATYTAYSPFFFKAEKTKIILAERQEIIKDSIDYILPYYTYQLVGYAPTGKEGRKDVEDEFKKFCKKYNKGFENNSIKKIGNGKEETGEIREFTIPLVAFPVLKVAWLSSEEKNENLFAITLSFLVTENMAHLPVPLYSF